MVDPKVTAYLDEVESLMRETRVFLDGKRIYPRRSHIDTVLLGLLSKSIVLSEAIVCLVRNGFEDEAFGCCRSSIEVQLTIRYLTNCDTEARTRRYFMYFTKDKSEWFRLAQKYYPDLSFTRPADADEIEKLAAAYKNPHKWSDAPGGLRDFAAEEDRFNLAEDGKPADELFYYEVLYKWMSHFVHATEPGIEKEHMPLPGDEFEVNYNAGSSNLGSRHAVRVSFLSVLLNLMRVLRYLGIDLPANLNERFEAVLKVQDQLPRT